MPRTREPPPRPFLKWVGGKRQLLPVLLQAVSAAGPFRRYHEPFLGGGALYFALHRNGQLAGGASLADVNENLMNAYYGVRDAVDDVVARLEVHRREHAESYFYRVRRQMPRTLAARAARVIYLNRTCYNGLYRENSKGRFNAPFGRYKNPLICDEVNLRAASEALHDVTLDARSFPEALAHAQAGDLVYLDPPYVPMSQTSYFTSYSADGFGMREQRMLAEAFAALAGRGVRVMLSNSMTEITQTLYKGFYINRVLANRSVNSRSDRRGKVAEALVTSFPLTASREPGRGGSTASIERILARQWLVENGYEDIAALIDDVTNEWKAAGKGTHRNWWDVLAGDSKGRPRTVAGRTFPVLQAAQLRQGIAVTESSLSRSPDEEAPAIRLSSRPGE